MKLPENIKGDGPCADCGTENNLCWFTDNVFWNSVVRVGDYKEPILCMNCFAIRVDKAGYECHWRLLPEWKWNKKSWFHLDGSLCEECPRIPGGIVYLTPCPLHDE